MGEVFETTDAELAEDLLLRQYGTRFRIRANGQRGGMRLAQAVLTPAIRFEYSRFAMSFTATAGPLGVLAFGHLTDGLLANGSDGSERRLGPGDVFLGVQPGHRFGATVENAQIEMAIKYCPTGALSIEDG